MKHFSKIIALLLCFVFVFSACGDEKKPDGKESATTASGNTNEEAGESSPSGGKEESKSAEKDGEEKSGKESEKTTESAGTESNPEPGKEQESSEGKEKDGDGKITAETNETKTSAKAADEDETETTEASEEELENAFLLKEGVYVLELFSFSGQFVEDGSNEDVKKIAAVRIVNTSDVAFQLLDFTLKTEGGKFKFRATTLLPGTRMTVLNSERKQFDGEKIESGKITLEAPFTEAPSIRSDKLKISFTDGFINAQNISDEKLENIYIYYKSTDDYGFFGGITYRVHIEEIEAGNIVQARTKNIRSDSSQIVFVTF